MDPAVLRLLACPMCAADVQHTVIQNSHAGEIVDGIVWCRACRYWWAIEDGLLEFLPPELGYHDDRKNFRVKYQQLLRDLPVEGNCSERVTSEDPRRTQQSHFDWYAANATQSYSEYQNMPFWRVVDALTFEHWKRMVPEDAWLLDVGCAQGRSSFPFADLPLNLVGIDISKALIRQAIHRSRQETTRARMNFLVADCSSLAMRDGAFDVVLVYGVLHHLPNPAHVCQEVARVLRPGGQYFGSENNRSAFRKLFDALQNLMPIWHEEAGEQPLISESELQQWFAGTGMTLNCATQVFLPPHLVNLLGSAIGGRLLCMTDIAVTRLPWLCRQGGLILAHGRRAPSLRHAPVDC